MFKFWDHHGILGINARNLLYIKPLNKKAEIAFADDKMRTKQYLAARGINSARLLGKITSEAELLKFPWDSLPNSFVLKPNAGYGGEGIIVITNREDGGWQTIKGDWLSQEELEEHITDVLDGRYSITGSTDIVFFEERLTSHKDMGELGQFGLPDIRVIVYNLVPVMAMVRVPTQEASGKANIHLGGMGLGVDLSKGEVTHMLHYNNIIKSHPDFGALKGFKIPYWDEVLLLATQIQQLVTLGYLAVDIVVDQDKGPALLEINARAGLAVQVANLAPLRDRLDRVSGVKVKTAEKGVRMAQDLFGNKIERSIQALSGKQVIGLEEEVILNLKQGTKTVKAKINPTMNKNYLEEGLFHEIAHEDGSENLTLGYTLAEERGKTMFHPLEMKDQSYQVILGKNAVKNFFIDVSRADENKKIPSIETEKGTPQPQQSNKQGDESNYWLQVDNVLADLDRQLGIVSQLRPLNADEEQTRFMKSDKYQPQFRYKPTPERLIDLKSTLDRMSIDRSTVLGQLFDDKRQELQLKADVLAVIGDDEHFPQAAEQHSGMPPEALIKRVETEMRALHLEDNVERSLSSEQAAEQMQEFLKEQGIFNWEVKVKKGIVSRCVIGKNNRLLVKQGERFSQTDVHKLIAHEIETHIYCTENGKLQPYQIFRRGTANYLKTQEGLAVYHQSQVVPDGTRNAVIGFQTVMWARQQGFREVYERLRELGMGELEAWKTTLKAKRGMSDTSKPGAFTKNLLYYWGYSEVENYLQQGKPFADLFLGKFELSQLELIQQIDGLEAPKYLPEGA